MHPRACHAAIAAICAQEQGKFWEMHDLLFAHQYELEDEDLNRYATQLGLNTAQFTTCTQSESARKRLDLDISEAKKFGVPATPVFFVNGWRHFGAKPPKKIRAALNKYPHQGSKTDSTPPTSTTPTQTQSSPQPPRASPPSSPRQAQPAPSKVNP